MTPPRIKYPELTLRVPPVFCGSVEHYVRIAAYGNSWIDTEMRFDKRMKSVHRTAIADVNGRMLLTVPIAKPQSMTSARWCDIRVSSHGEWPDVHRVALESAYGRTPFFEFYADRFLPLLRADGQPVTEIDAEFDAAVRSILRLPQPLPSPPAEGLVSADDTLISIPEYYQIRAGRLGFISGLSVLDLIFNLGPEAEAVIKRAMNKR